MTCIWILVLTSKQVAFRALYSSLLHLYRGSAALHCKSVPSHNICMPHRHLEELPGLRPLVCREGCMMPLASIKRPDSLWGVPVIGAQCAVIPTFLRWCSSYSLRCFPSILLYFSCCDSHQFTGNPSLTQATLWWEMLKFIKPPGIVPMVLDPALSFCGN